MSLHAIAHGLMRAAARVAPKERADWAQAMRAELASVEGGAPALGWAAGCVVTALGWRLQGEAFYLAALAAVWLGSTSAQGLLIDFGESLDLGDAVDLGEPARGLVMGTACLALALWRPRRSLLAIFVVAVLADWWTATQMTPEFLKPAFESPFAITGGRPTPYWLFSLNYFVRVYGPVLLGAGLGWGIGRMRRHWSVRA